MRRAQFSLFIIVGLVIVISLGILLFIMRISAFENPMPEVEEAKIHAETCLRQTTMNAVAGLINDGVITISESGPLADDTYYYIKQNDDMPLGENAYWGLCQKNGPNAIGQYADKRYTCPQDAYQHRGLPSIQEMLQVSISNQMRECFGVDADAEVIMQSDGFVVRWPEPELSYKQTTNHNVVWNAIKEVVDREVSEVDFTPGTTDIKCPGCDKLTISEYQRDDKSADRPYNIYEFGYNNIPTTRVYFEDREAYIDALMSGDTPNLDEYCVSEITSLTLRSFDEDVLTVSTSPTPRAAVTITPDTSSYEYTLTITPANDLTSGEVITETFTLTIHDEFNIAPRDITINVEANCL